MATNATKYVKPSVVSPAGPWGGVVDNTTISAPGPTVAPYNPYAGVQNLKTTIQNGIFSPGANTSPYTPNATPVPAPNMSVPTAPYNPGATVVNNPNPAVKQPIVPPAVVDTALAQLLQEQADIAAGRKPAGYVAPTGITNSDPTKTALDDAKAKLDALIAKNAADKAAADAAALKTPGFVSPDTQASQDAIEARRVQLQQQAADYEANLRKTYASRIVDQGKTNDQLFGTNQAFLARAGAFSSAGGQGSLAATKQAGEKQISDLLLQEESAVQAARAASSAEDFTLLSKKLAEAETARTEINKIRQQEFDNTVTSQNQQMSKEAADAKAAGDTFTYLDQLTSEQLKTFGATDFAAQETALGLPSGYFQQFGEAKKASEEAKSTADKQKAGLDFLALAIKMPAGSTFKLNGETITGLDVGANKVFQSTDNAGGVHFTTVDGKGNVINTSSVGRIGKSATGASTGVIPASLVTKINEAFALVGQGAKGSEITLQDAMLALYQDPDVVANPEAQKGITTMFSAVSKLDPAGSFTGYVIKNADGSSSIVPFDKTTGNPGDAILPVTDSTTDTGGNWWDFLTAQN